MSEKELAVHPVSKHIDAVLQTESGRALWAYLANRCGFFSTSLSKNSAGEIAPLSTECKEAQRLIYLELRRLATRQLLVVAEELAETPVV